jgi:hypothetical protein
MIAMQVADKNVPQLTTPDPVPGYLYLRSFAAVYQQQLVVAGNYLGSGVPVQGGDGRVVT